MRIESKKKHFRSVFVRIDVREVQIRTVLPDGQEVQF